MKTAIVLLAIVAVLPPGSPNPDVRPDPSTTANPATSANASAAATALVIFGSDTIRAEVANTSETRSRGLMYRDEVPDGTGMLFVFDREAERSFWMQNTYVALDVAFIDANFRIVDIQQMEPESTDIHDGARPAMFALEVRQGWFAEKGIAVGDRCEFIFLP
ncbi:MAG: DUF192 domain-containing protein [Gemmatimonadetes bacterium]|jgi:uncharacterized membrane protein (UPF0127 family)|nr:DUF192 domain-containing protein [Gemmatimonadota bacterium]